MMLRDGQGLPSFLFKIFPFSWLLVMEGVKRHTQFEQLGEYQVAGLHERES